MILVLNLGSSSVKYALFSPQLKRIKSDYLENIKDHEKAIKQVLKQFSQEELQDISLIAHRVVHGGERFTQPIKITTQTLKKIETLNDIAPLHNPINIKGIKICQKLFPKVSNVAVFDTAFHSTMTEEHYLYAIPKKYYKKYGIRRYGFHGDSHQYLWETYKSTYANKKKKNQTIITCHLGNGASIALIKNGKTIETSMGFTPLEGLVMGTRSGNIDPAIIPFLMRKEKLQPDQIETILNKESGLGALSEGICNMKILIEEYAKNPKAKLAISVFINSVAKYIGAYTALEGPVDAIIFSGGIGERGKFVREKIIKKVKHLGDPQFLVIPTNEEYIIAKEAQKVK